MYRLPKGFLSILDTYASAMAYGLAIPRHDLTAFHGIFCDEQGARCIEGYLRKRIRRSSGGKLNVKHAKPYLYPTYTGPKRNSDLTLYLGVCLADLRGTTIVNRHDITRLYLLAPNPFGLVHLQPAPIHKVDQRKQRILTDRRNRRTIPA